MRSWLLRGLLLAFIGLLPSAAFAQCNFAGPVPANTVLGRIGAGQAGPCEAIPFATLSGFLTTATITLNTGNGLTAPGAMSSGNTYSLGATTDTLQAKGFGLGVAGPSTGLEIINAAISPTGNGQLVAGASSTNGAVWGGQGSLYDSCVANNGLLCAIGIPTGTQNVVLPGLSSATGTIAGAVCYDSTGKLLPSSSANCFAASGVVVAGGKTVTFNNTLTFNGTDSTTFTLPGSSATLAGLGTTQTFSGTNTFSGTLNITGTGQLNGAAFGTFATANAATPPAIGGTTPAAGSFTTLTATTPIGLSSGGTNASTAAGARASTGLNIDSFTAHGDSNLTMTASMRVVGTSATLTAARTWTLPAASAVNAGQSLIVQDFINGVSNTDTLTILRAGTDTLNGSSTSVVINTAGGGFLLISDGVSNWSAQALGAQASSGVSSINGITGTANVVAGSGIGVNTAGGNITVSNNVTLGGAIVGSAASVFVEQFNPGGRLTVVSGGCNVTTDQAAQTVLYYAPCAGEWVPIYNGTNMQLYQFTASATDTVGLSINLASSSNWAATTLYDVFVGITSSTVTLCTGPAWTNSGAGTSARSASLATYKGMQTNASSMTCRSGASTTFTCAANQCTYLGTVLTGASQGTIDLKFGTAASNCGQAILSIWNAYNSIPVRATVADTTTFWTYTTASWRAAHGQSACSVQVVQGLTGPAVTVIYADKLQTVANTAFALIGVGLNSSSGLASRANSAIAQQSTAAVQSGETAVFSDALLLGLNQIYAIEQGDGTNANQFVGSATGFNQMQLTFNGQM